MKSREEVGGRRRRREEENKRRKRRIRRRRRRRKRRRRRRRRMRRRKRRRRGRPQLEAASLSQPILPGLNAHCQTVYSLQCTVYSLQCSVERAVQSGVSKCHKVECEVRLVKFSGNVAVPARGTRDLLLHQD